MAVIAAFDVDGTLTSRDCVWPFLAEITGRAGLASIVGRRSLPLLRAAAQRNRDRAKQLLVGGVFVGRSVESVDVVGERFAGMVYDSWMRPDTLARLRWHQENGHRIVLVSASLGPYLRPLGRRLGADDVLCTDVRQENGVYLDTLEGGNCRGSEKVRRLDAWLEATGERDSLLWAYGDSRGDADLLGRVDRPEYVRHRVLSATPEEVIR
ncbi:MAG: HAD-IB family hydrolase [Ilumatobacteraceae bacterium]